MAKPQTCKHYVTGAFPSRPPVRLNDEEYGRALDALVKACVDVVIVHRETKKVLLGNRRVHPQPGLWFIGGRMVPGESPEATAARHVFHDTRLSIPASDFTFVTVASYLWAMRHQPPAENGTADIALTYFCFIDAEQAAKIECGNKAECALQRPSTSPDTPVHFPVPLVSAASACKPVPRQRPLLRLLIRRLSAHSSGARAPDLLPGNPAGTPRGRRSRGTTSSRLLRVRMCTRRCATPS